MTLESGTQAVGRRASSSVPTHMNEVPHGELLKLIGPEGKYQIGVGGKLLPKLPKGTKVGDLVMGEYGLYSPKIRANQEYFQSKPETPVYLRGKHDKTLMAIVYLLVAASMVGTAWNSAVLIHGKPLWPMKTKE